MFHDALRLEPLETVEFTLRPVRHKRHRAFAIGKLSTSMGEVVIDDRRSRRDFGLETSVPAFRAGRLLQAVKNVRTGMRSEAFYNFSHYNCVSFAHDLAGTFVNGDIGHGLPKGWDFSLDVPIHKLPDGATGLLLQRGTPDPREVPQGVGHWYTILNREAGLAIHVDGGGGPLLISPTSSLRSTYPEPNYRSHHAIPPLQV